MARPILFGTGWVPDPPDERDLGFGQDQIRELLAGTAVHDALRRGQRRLLPDAVDLRRWCSPVHFQGYYNTCTCHVVTSMVELLENRAHGSYVPASRLFLYQVAKRLLGETGDPGVYLRQMMGSVVLTGVPPEKYWPYLDTDRKDDPRVDAEPDAFCYAVARDFGASRYFRVDTSDAGGDEVRDRLCALLGASMPSSLGFPLYQSSLEHAAATGEVPMPAAGERAVGAHAVLLVGYDDGKTIGGTAGAEETTGAFLFKNSWGADWGAAGYGWLPYRYLTAGLAKDCWTMMQAKWLETDAFQLDLEVANGGSTGAEAPVAASASPQPPSRESRARVSSTRSRSTSPSAQKPRKAR
ncbi:MAG TPA: C1 family peptidase [Thermoanaerobaculia bacterium]|nr:C1 family peptidase [Thermoanaerobaculia bacterium]